MGTEEIVTPLMTLAIASRIVDKTRNKRRVKKRNIMLKRPRVM